MNELRVSFPVIPYLGQPNSAPGHPLPRCHDMLAICSQYVVMDIDVNSNKALSLVAPLAMVTYFLDYMRIHTEGMRAIQEEVAIR